MKFIIIIDSPWQVERSCFLECFTKKFEGRSLLRPSLSRVQPVGFTSYSLFLTQKSLCHNCGWQLKYVHVWLGKFVIQQKLLQTCTLTILQKRFKK